MIQTKTTAIILLVAIATIGTIGIGTTTQSAHAVSDIEYQQNPATANPHPTATSGLPAEPTGNPHQFPNCGGNPHGQVGAETENGSPLPQCNGSK